MRMYYRILIIGMQPRKFRPIAREDASAVGATRALVCAGCERVSWLTQGSYTASQDEKGSFAGPGRDNFNFERAGFWYEIPGKDEP